MKISVKYLITIYSLKTLKGDFNLNLILRGKKCE